MEPLQREWQFPAPLGGFFPLHLDVPFLPLLLALLRPSFPSVGRLGSEAFSSGCWRSPSLSSRYLFIPPRLECARRTPRRLRVEQQSGLTANLRISWRHSSSGVAPDSPRVPPSLTSDRFSLDPLFTRCYLFQQPLVLQTPPSRPPLPFPFLSLKTFLFHLAQHPLLSLI